MGGYHPLFGILILNYNGRHWLPGLFDSLRDDGYDRRRVYLVDNNSDERSVEITREGYPEVSVLRLP